MEESCERARAAKDEKGSLGRTARRKGGTKRKKGKNGWKRRRGEGVEGTKRIFVVIKSLRFLNAARHVSAARRGNTGGGGARWKKRRGGRGRGGKKDEGRRREGTRNAGTLCRGGTKKRRGIGSRREKRRHDDRAINNIGEKGDRLQHSAQMLNRYQFNAAQSANR